MHRLEAKVHFESLAAAGKGTLGYREVARGYAYLLALTAG